MLSSSDHTGTPPRSKESQYARLTGKDSPISVVFLNTCYDAFINSHYRHNPALAGASYEHQLQAINNTFFGDSDFYSRGLIASGLQATDLVVNCDPMQNSWAAQHGISQTGYNLVAHQIQHIRPDVIYVQDMAGTPPELLSMRDSTSVSCHLAIREGRDVLYIYRALASQRLSVNVPIGTRLPCHSNALGRALLMGVDESELSQLYSGVQLDNAPKPNPQSLLELRQRIKEEKQQGFAVNQSDYATAIAAPIRNYANQVIAAINITGPDVFMMGTEIREEITRQLQATALKISEEMGHRANRA